MISPSRADVIWLPFALLCLGAVTTIGALALDAAVFWAHRWRGQRAGRRDPQ